MTLHGFALVGFHIGHGQFMQNALNVGGPVDQAKRSVLHRLVSHGSGANLCSSYI